MVFLLFAEVFIPSLANHRNNNSFHSISTYIVALCLLVLTLTTSISHVDSCWGRKKQNTWKKNPCGMLETVNLYLISHLLLRLGMSIKELRSGVFFKKIFSVVTSLTFFYFFMCFSCCMLYLTSFSGFQRSNKLK